MKAIHICEECGCELYVGELAYNAGTHWYCERCCGLEEVEEPEPDYDLEIDKLIEQRRGG